MARPPRLDLAGVPQHVIQRGNNRGGCFFGDVDRRFFLKSVGESAARRGCSLHAYVLMTNHVHLLLTPLEKGAVAAMLQDVGRRYVRTINTIHGRTGTLWEGRFRASLVDTERYFLTCQRYIELNPVRAGLLQDPAEYPWSSHSHYVGIRADPLITEHPLFTALGSTRGDRELAYKSLFTSPIDDGTLAKIRSAINTDSMLGSEDFLQDTEMLVGRSVRPAKRGRPPKIVSGKLL